MTKGSFFHHFKGKGDLALHAAWSAESVGYFIQSVLQGSFIFAKAKQSPEVVRDSLAHLRRYLISLFDPSRTHYKETL